MKLGQIPLIWGSLASLFGGQSPPSFANPLPAPSSVNWRSTSPVKLAGSLTLSGPGNELLDMAFKRTLDHIEKDQWAPPPVLVAGQTVPFNDSIIPSNFGELPSIETVHVSVGDLESPLQHGVDESYRLDVSSDRIKVTAKTVWGALHALTTLEQLVLTTQDYGRIIEGAVTIKDSPKYPYRGLHIDTSRNFYSIDSLKRQIDTMALAKMNVFHWHLTDSQSWPVEVTSYPQMTKDAYSTGEVYSADDIKEIVQYAWDRGVRVVPELDMPGHSAAGWKEIDPELIACKDTYWEDTAVEPTPGHLDILNPELYPTLSKIYNDISGLFKDSFFHVGFDELNTGCYKTSQRTREWMEEDESRTWSDLAQYWVDKTLPIFKNRPDRKLVMWQDSVTSEDIPARSIPKDVVLQVWTGGLGKVKELTSKGYEVIVSSADFLYLDCGFGSWIGNDDRHNVQMDPSPGTPSFNFHGDGGSWCGPYKSWQRIYSLDLTTGLTTEESSRVIGGAAALWSEQSDGSTVDGIVWPRTASLAELLWSGNSDSKGNYRGKDLTQRLLAFRERLVGRGVNAHAIMPKWCLHNPHKCDFKVSP
ncbi:hypothetical protein TRVA0_010S02388 [Trichomonascus vanleenenianus]|uniref:beta-N-acetylhexosaminidase n=1 Tax=Trichomonascus vanleenenianus TaxID=2268995 RepID=UPI003ECA7B71